jgi:hypothetical protein
MTVGLAASLLLRTRHVCRIVSRRLSLITVSSCQSFILNSIGTCLIGQDCLPTKGGFGFRFLTPKWLTEPHSSSRFAHQPLRYINLSKVPLPIIPRHQFILSTYNNYFVSHSKSVAHSPTATCFYPILLFAGPWLDHHSHTMSQITLRPATPDDLPAIYTIGFGRPEDASAVSLDRTKHFYAQPYYHFIVAVQAEEIVGYIVWKEGGEFQEAPFQPNLAESVNAAFIGYFLGTADEHKNTLPIKGLPELEMLDVRPEYQKRVSGRCW